MQAPSEVLRKILFRRIGAPLGAYTMQNLNKEGSTLRPTVYIWGHPEQYGAYQEAVRRAGGRPGVSLDLRKASDCDALLLPGGGDLESWRYGQADEACRNTEPERDTVEFSLLELFVSAAKPVLGICRGLQTINVFFGGTLIQDLPGHSQAQGLDRLHYLRTAPSPLGNLWGAGIVVNSAHHQAAGRLGTGLQAVQWAPDGTVEAILHQTLPVWAVQYHPERFPKHGCPEGTQLFSAWLALCRCGKTEKRRD